MHTAFEFNAKPDRNKYTKMRTNASKIEKKVLICAFDYCCIFVAGQKN